MCTRSGCSTRTLMALCRAGDEIGRGPKGRGRYIWREEEEGSGTQRDKDDHREKRASERGVKHTHAALRQRSGQTIGRITRGEGGSNGTLYVDILRTSQGHAKSFATILVSGKQGDVNALDERWVGTFSTGLNFLNADGRGRTGLKFRPTYRPSRWSTDLIVFQSPPTR